MDANEVARGLWVGSAPDSHDPELARFDLIVFAAEEYQPRGLKHYRGDMILCGIADDPREPDAFETRKLLGAAKQVAQRLFDGQKVLVTCISGWNRSGLIAALALKMCTPLNEQQIVGRIRAARGRHALSNQWFLDFLERANVY
jgi:protein-tyrosine phosphatase